MYLEEDKSWIFYICFYGLSPKIWFQKYFDNFSRTDIRPPPARIDGEKNLTVFWVQIQNQHQPALFFSIYSESLFWFATCVCVIIANDSFHCVAPGNPKWDVVDRGVNDYTFLWKSYTSHSITISLSPTMMFRFLVVALIAVSWIDVLDTVNEQLELLNCLELLWKWTELRR